MEHSNYPSFREQYFLIKKSSPTIKLWDSNYIPIIQQKNKTKKKKTKTTHYSEIITREMFRKFTSLENKAVFNPISNGMIFEWGLCSRWPSFLRSSKFSYIPAKI